MKRMDQSTKRTILVCVAAAAAVILVFIAARRVSDIVGSGTDTSAGVEYIKEQEEGSVPEIESKISRLENGGSQSGGGAQSGGQNSGAAAGGSQGSSAADGGNADERSVKERFTGAVVMGDTVAQGLAEFDVLNTSSVTARIGGSLSDLDSQIETVRKISPKSVLLAFGAEDVIATGGDADAFITEYTSALEQIRKELPEVNIFINAILPAQQEAVDREPVLDKIPGYNTALKELCDSRAIGFIDSTELAREEFYQPDGLHFTPDFYPLWAEHMAEVAAL